MTYNVLTRRLDALRGLAKRLAGESAGGVLEDALEALRAGTRARACVAFGVDGTLDPVAQRGELSAAGHDALLIKRILHRLASHAATTRRPLVVLDVRRELSQLGEPSDSGQLLACGIRALQIEPVLHRRSVLAIIIAVFEEPPHLDEQARHFIEALSSVVALGLEGEHRAEQDRAQRERLSASGAPGVGLLTTAVAQELRGPASALVVQADELRNGVEQLGMLAGRAETPLGVLCAELTELSQDMSIAVTRLTETTDRLLAMGKRESSPEHVDLSNVARRSIGVARQLLQERGVPLEEQYEANCVTVGRRDDLEQVVLNLVLNAAEAAAHAQRPHIWLKVHADANHVSLVVEDSGPGVAADQVENIFQPFYTTKASGRGAGLGLKIVSEVVAAHGGHIEVQQRSGGGASFRVVLPRAVRGAGLAASPVPGPAPGPGLYQVFVVEDDPIFSRALRRGLKPHQVQTAASASEAEMVLLDPSYQPDLVVCDVFLPGAHGDVLHQRIKSRRPDVAARFVFVTGAALAKSEADYLRSSGCVTLLKPVDVNDLRSLLGPRKHPESTPATSVKTLAEVRSDLPTVVPGKRDAGD